MPTIIDPTKPLNSDELELLNQLLQAEDEKESTSRKKLQRGFFNKESNREGKEKPGKSQEVKFAHSVMKINNRYYVIHRDSIGHGSQDVKVKLMPSYFMKNSEGKYVQMIDEAAKDGVCVKVFGRKSFNKPINKIVKDQDWEELKNKLQHEYLVLVAIGDAQAELFIDEANRKIYLKQTLAQGESLENFLNKKENLSLPERLLLAEKMIILMKDLHDKGFAHLDFHLGNIMIDEKTGNLKLIDFGSAENLKAKLKDYPLEKQRTNFYYRPFNYANNSPQAVDYYSLAGALGQMFSFNQNEVDVLSKKTKIQEIPLFSRDKIMGNKTADQEQVSKYLQDRSYDFDCLLSEGNLEKLNPEERKKITEIATFLKVLGAEDLETRNKVNFNTIFTAFNINSSAYAKSEEGTHEKVIAPQPTSPKEESTSNSMPANGLAQKDTVLKPIVKKDIVGSGGMPKNDVTTAICTPLNIITPKHRNLLKIEVKTLHEKLDGMKIKDKKIKEFVSSLSHIINGEAVMDAQSKQISATLLQLLKNICGYIETMKLDAKTEKKPWSVIFSQKNSQKEDGILSVFQTCLNKDILKELGLEALQNESLEKPERP